MLTKFLKDYGKTRPTSDYTSITNPFLGGITYEGKVMYATVDGNEYKSQVWIGIDTSRWLSEDISLALSRVERLVYQFGVEFYRSQVQKEIDDSQEAFDATEKQTTKLINQNKDLLLRMSNNEQEKLHLDKAIEANKLEKIVLLQRLENNTKAQDSVANASIQIKKVLESQKQKQKKIN